MENWPSSFFYSKPAIAPVRSRCCWLVFAWPVAGWTKLRFQLRCVLTSVQQNKLASSDGTLALRGHEPVRADGRPDFEIKKSAVSFLKPQGFGHRHPSNRVTNATDLLGSPEGTTRLFCPSRPSPGDRFKWCDADFHTIFLHAWAADGNTSGQMSQLWRQCELAFHEPWPLIYIRMRAIRMSRCQGFLNGTVRHASARNSVNTGLCGVPVPVVARAESIAFSSRTFSRKINQRTQARLEATRSFRMRDFHTWKHWSCRDIQRVAAFWSFVPMNLGEGENIKAWLLSCLSDFRWQMTQARYIFLPASLWYYYPYEATRLRHLKGTAKDSNLFSHYYPTREDVTRLGHKLLSKQLPPCAKHRLLLWRFLVVIVLCRKLLVLFGP